MNQSVIKAVRERIAKLEEVNAYNARQIQFLAQRLEDFKTNMKADVVELVDLKAFLAESKKKCSSVERCPSILDVDTPGAQILANCELLKGHDGAHTGEGQCWNDPKPSTTCPSLPQHTSIIVG